VSRYARLAIPVILVIVVAIVVVALVRDGDDSGSKTGTSTDATAYGPPPDADEAPQPQASPAAAARLNRVIARVQRRALAEAPAVAGPVISQARNAGRITSAQAAALRKAARSLARGEGIHHLAGTVDVSDPGVGAVVRKSLDALKPRAQELAKTDHR
jgi:hypothetical protein